MRPEQLYASPFTDEFATGPRGVFGEQDALQALVSTLAAIKRMGKGYAGGR
jgi:hypothetical protein